MCVKQNSVISYVRVRKPESCKHEEIVAEVKLFGSTDDVTECDSASHFNKPHGRSRDGPVQPPCDGFHAAAAV